MTMQDLAGHTLVSGSLSRCTEVERSSQVLPRTELVELIRLGRTETRLVLYLRGGRLHMAEHIVTVCPLCEI